MKKLLTLLALGVVSAQAKNFSFKGTVFSGVANSGFKEVLSAEGKERAQNHHERAKAIDKEHNTKDTKAAVKEAAEVLNGKTKTHMIFGATAGAAYGLCDSMSAGLEAGLFFNMAKYGFNKDEAKDVAKEAKSGTKRNLVWTFGPNFTYNLNSKFSLSLAANMLLTKLAKANDIGSTRHFGFGPKLSADYMFTSNFGATVFAGYFFFPGEKSLKKDGKVVDAQKIKHKNMFAAGAGLVVKL